MACARCHDHKFDPITQRDYYALAGVFSSTRYREAPLVPNDVVETYTAGQRRIQQAEQALERSSGCGVAAAGGGSCREDGGVPRSIVAVGALADGNREAEFGVFEGTRA